jgi:hypothetical protein
VNGRGGILRRIRKAGLLLALIALVLKASASPGYMIEQSGGRLIATLCSGAPIVLDLGGDGPRKHDGSTHDVAPCPFAVAAQIAAPPPPPITIAPRGESGRAIVIAGVASQAVTGLAAPPPWARGPPISV